MPFPSIPRMFTVTQVCTTQKSRRAKISPHTCRGLQKTISFRNRDFAAVWKRFWNNNYLIRGRVFATFSTLEKALASRMLCRPAVTWSLACRGTVPTVPELPTLPFSAVERSVHVITVFLDTLTSWCGESKTWLPGNSFKETAPPSVPAAVLQIFYVAQLSMFFCLLRKKFLSTSDYY